MILDTLDWGRSLGLKHGVSAPIVVHWQADIGLFTRSKHCRTIGGSGSSLKNGYKLIIVKGVKGCRGEYTGVHGCSHHWFGRLLTRIQH
jgi:hypothetical protein